ncbi:MAG: Gp138 family membrane-puncturing spike protein [Gemmiger formicilis]|uniref:Gp138 family membrane-puncturing spike protein n=1 Tax=Gemmiger formicilis TaxID=745368 RepID=UPI00399300F5
MSACSITTSDRLSKLSSSLIASTGASSLPRGSTPAPKATENHHRNERRKGGTYHAEANRKQAYEDAKKQADAAGLCVADVVKVLAFDEAALTVDVQPITRYPDEDTFQTKPPVLAVPVATIYGGGFVIRPVYKAGDIGVVVYLDRDSDAVIAGGAEADPNTERLHSGDDAVFVGGIRTGGSSISGLPAGSLSLGTSDGGVYLSISPSGIDIKGNVTITGDLTVTGGVVNLN